MKKRGNGNKEIEHPKSMLEVIANTKESVENYSAMAGLTLEQGALVLVLNELRCLHFHVDQFAALAIGKADALSKTP